MVRAAWEERELPGGVFLLGATPAGSILLDHQLYLPQTWCSNRPSHEDASSYFDQSIRLCRRGGFQKIRLRGDTDFTQTEHLDRWDR